MIKAYTQSINKCRTAAYKADVATHVLRKLHERGVNLSAEQMLLVHVYVDKAVRSKVRRLELAREREVLNEVSKLPKPQPEQFNVYRDGRIEEILPDGRIGKNGVSETRNYEAYLRGN